MCYRCLTFPCYLFIYLRYNVLFGCVHSLWNDEDNSINLLIISHAFMVRIYKIYSAISEYIVCYKLLVMTGPIVYNRSLKRTPSTRLCILCILLHMSQALVSTVPLSRTSESTQGREEIILTIYVPVLCAHCVLGSKAQDYPEHH